MWRNWDFLTLLVGVQNGAAALENIWSSSKDETELPSDSAMYS
jgi:hypothetical protein